MSRPDTIGTTKILNTRYDIRETLYHIPRKKAIKLYHNSSPCGFGLVEIIIAVAIITGALFASAVMVRLASRGVKQGVYNEQATVLTEEGVEVVRLMRDVSWSTNIVPLAPGLTYYPVFDVGTRTWSLSTTNPGSINNIFTRTVFVEDVYRKNADDDIVDASSPEPKTMDSGTQKITVRTSWGTYSKEIATYMSDIFSN